ncbi:MAG TPA: aminotransferase [Clostridiales bacterium]|nr:aminotransferase [Clostridiales bacterium]
MHQFADRFDGVTGSEIRKIFALLSDPEIISFAGGNPSPEAFPNETLAQIASGLIASDGARVLQYGNTKGLPELLSLLAGQNSGVMKEYDDIIMLSGSSQGIELFTRTMLNEGDAMLVESPTFLGALQTFFLARADVRPVELQEDGVDLADLECKIERYAPKFFYIIPTFQNPSGITTSGEKRRRVYELCKQYGVMVLEDDPYAELRYEGEPLPSIKSYDDSGLVCRLQSFSKTVSPGLRVGYAIAHRDVIGKFNLLKQGQDVHTSNLTQAMVYEFLRGGYFGEHVAALCKRYKAQRDCMLAAIEKYFPKEVRCTRPLGGLFLWAALPEGMDAKSLFSACVERKVAFVPGQPFFVEPGHENTLRMNFSMPNCADIEAGVERMGRIIREYTY